MTKSAFFKSLSVLCGTLFLSSCVVVRESEPETFADTATCQVSVSELCSFQTWEKACRACDNPRFFKDLRFSSDLLGECSKNALCRLCHAGFSVCDVPHAEWRFEVRPEPPPPPRKPPPRHHRGRPDDFPGR